MYIWLIDGFCGTPYHYLVSCLVSQPKLSPNFNIQFVVIQITFKGYVFH